MAEKTIWKAVLFDLEGTLVDFQWNLKKAAREILGYLEQYGLDLETYGPDPDYARLFNVTQASISTWPQDRAAELIEQLAPIYDYYDADALSRWQPYPDTVSTLNALFSTGTRMGIVSNCGKNAISQVLEKFDLIHYFELVISRNDVQFVKPDPEGLIAACNKLDIPPGDALFVGDSVNDIVPATNIGMPSCFLNSGESRVTGANDHHATYEIASLAGLLKL